MRRQLLHFREQRLDVLLGALDEIRHVRLRAVGRRVELALEVFDAGRRGADDAVDRGAGRVDVTLGEIGNRALRLLKQILRRVVGLLRLRHDLIAILLGERRNLLRQRVVLGLRVVVGLLDIGKCALGRVERTLRAVLRPAVGLIGDLGSLLLQALRLADRILDALLDRIHHARDARQRLAGRILD